MSLAQPPGSHLAQLNIGRLRAEPGSPEVAGFMDNIARINALGQRAPGFVWMLQGEGEETGATDLALDGDPRLVPNLTVWRSPADLERFVFATAHRQFFARRAEWFEPQDEAHLVMWWVPDGHRPGLAEALERLAHLRAQGASAHAFGWEDLPGLSLWQRHAGTGRVAVN